jgi:glucan 1,4-alpha-glucosidase
MKKYLLRFLTLALPFTLYLLPCFAQQGNDAQWATAGKQAVGTSASLNSKVWFTLANGVMTEVYYPDVTVANVHLLQFVVVNPKTKKVETEMDDAIHQIRVTRPDSLSFQQINTAKSGVWKITKTYTTDVERDSILIDVKFETKDKNLKLYLYFDPSLSNSGMKDEGRIPFNSQLSVKDNLKSDNGASAIRVSSPLGELSNSFLGVNDGLEQLKKDGKISKTNERLAEGNIVQFAQILEPKQFTVTLSFAKNILTAGEVCRISSQKGFAKAQAEYEKQWSDYVKTLRQVDAKYQAQFNMAAMILKAFEDKTNRGANIASLSKPWGGAANANDVGSSGYHAVWARDLYQVATAFMALGDNDAANRALDFLFKIQQKPDGSFPQNSWIDGRPIGGSLQMDQVGFPLILAHELGRFDGETYQKHIKPAADFIVKNGPTTPQERWEEKGGYSPSTIAATIAGLVCAAEIAKKNNDFESANRWLKTADEWAANVEKWTVTTTGKHSKEPYYVRLTQNGKPDAGEKYEINGVFGMVDERDIVDAGFLELVRLGIKSPDDKIIQNSLKVVDQVIKVNTPNGDGFYRYNFDSYGEPDNGQRWNWDGKYTGKGRLWALLSGERGQFEIAECGMRNAEKGGNPRVSKGENFCLEKANQRLNSMLNFANDGLMIPEQIWDSPNIPKNIDRQFIPELKFGEGTGSATPLAWSMAQFIRLAVNVKEGRNLDTPKVVYDRYVLGKKSERLNSILNGMDLTRSGRSGKEEEIKFGNPLFAACGTVGNCENASNEMFACFAYKGEFKTIEIAGDFTSWKPKPLSKIEKLDGKSSDGKSFDCLIFPNSARVEYKLIVDGKWITDPLNPNKVDNGVGGENSFFTMPDYKVSEWANSEGQTKYPIYSEKINSKIHSEKELEVYVPEGFEKQSLPVLYLQDGGDYQNRADAVFIQRNLVKANKIKPFIMVFLNPKDRMKEYWANDDYANFLAEEVVPMIDSKYNTIKSREGRAVMGASLGGITAVHVGLKYPQVFGRIGGQSSSFWIDNERVVKELEKLDGKTKFQFYFDDGTLEGVEDSRKVVKILRDKGFDVTYIEGEAGHNWTAWRDRLADAFMAIWK